MSDQQSLPLSLSPSSESIKEESIVSPNQKDEGHEEQSLSSSLSSSPTNESQGLLLLRQALKMSSTTEITMPDGTKVEVFSKPKQVNAASEFVQILSEDRGNLTPKEQADIRMAIVRKQHDLYNQMDLTSTNIDELVGFQANLKTTERHFGRFDLLQVFQIVDPERDSNGSILPALKAGSQYRDLFKWYAMLKVEDVEASNEWYNLYTVKAWYAENMGLTYEYLKTHMSQGLFTKVSEEYNLYPIKSRGGPLLLYLMIQQLIASNDSIARTLSKKIETIRISTYKGENVGEVVTHLRAIVQRLKNMRRRDASGNEIDLVPLDLAERLYDVLQSSSSEEFTSLFKTQYTTEYVQSLTVGQSAWSDPEKILILAQNLYFKLCADGKWIGVNQNKATFPTFTSPKAASAFLGKVNCHNCGGQHFLRDCQQPLDQARIDANRQRVIDARLIAKKAGSTKTKGSRKQSQNGHPPGGKFPPKPGRKQNNRCEVDGKPFYYHYKTNKWLPADRQANHSEATRATSTASSTATSQSNRGHTSSAAHLAEHNLIIANMTNQFADAMSALSASVVDRS
jgi:hypothetical protein